MKYPRIILLALLILLLITPIRVMAQNAYSFQIPQLVVNVFWNDDGTTSIDYLFSFNNDPTGHIIDYVDVGIPTSQFDVNSIRADVNGKAVSDISTSGFQGSGSGVAIGLGSLSIPSGKSGNVHVFIGTVSRMMYPSTQDSNNASVNFIPHYYDSATVHGKTDLSVIFHLPPGVLPTESVWYAAPAGWQTEPATSLDDQGRVMFTWRNNNANGYTSYLFGAGFPLKYVPASAIVKETIFDKIGKFIGMLTPFLVPLGCVGFIVWIVYASTQAEKKRKMQYLPPKISIEGHGIKRGLTSIEAAILMEEPMDKIMTMILFAVIKKNAAQVITREPLEIQGLTPVPEGLQPYETDFLAGFAQPAGIERRKALQAMVVNLVKSVSEKMKGFSRKETVTYYRDIIQKAWVQVEAAGTPEVKSVKYDEVMEWTMLDHDYDERTRRTFSSGPVFVPMWWGRYDPGFGRPAVHPSGTPVSMPTSVGGGPISLPHLPGSDFAASVVKGVQNFSSSVVGNITDFTSGVTKVTNPPPPPSTYRSSGGGGGGGGHSCACACACAGCACACAGGGR